MRLTGISAAFDRRLDPASRAPIAVGFSGGGDSLALLILTLDWARAHGRPVLSLTVDHQLQPASAAWTREAVTHARDLGANALSLAWTGDKPTAGLSAAARRARHALLAQAARAAGARVLLLGHTADDRMEAAAMRAEGSTVSDPRDWSPSPVWPEGRDVFLLRPLLDQRRSDLRDFLRERGETWLDDPANDDPRSARARARRSLAATGAPAAEPARRAPPIFEGDPVGVIALPRDAAAAHLAAACLCAAGTERPPRGERLERLVARLRSGELFTATLAGARIEAGPDAVRFHRDAGESARGGLADLALGPHETGVWDGRYEITAGKAAVTVRALKGLAASLSKAQRAALKATPAAARQALPALALASGGVVCPMLGGPALAVSEGVRIRALFLDRFRAATGLIDQECVT
ncbi:tRNA lysidine(34) synthetase TilS [Caulobacter sp. ErkDOM-E]|uniref:tRNA lysidine(34) synthetase TilS n=1 Tax=Caulobacter sp. ErkDOM-E TaxID=3402778 RepID=UPI003AF8CC40